MITERPLANGGFKAKASGAAFPPNPPPPLKLQCVFCQTVKVIHFLKESDEPVQIKPDICPACYERIIAPDDRDELIKLKIVRW